MDATFGELVSMRQNMTQRDIARKILQDRGIVRSNEIRAAGVTGATIRRMLDGGEVTRLARGLYQLPDAPLEVGHSLAEAAKRVPRGVVCLTSALSYHGLTDQLPRSVWIAVGKNDSYPRGEKKAFRFVWFTEALLTEDVDTVVIEGVPVRVFGVAKTVADCFRHRRSVGLVVALEGLQEALRQRKATPAEIVRSAKSGGVYTIVSPYLEALTANA